MKRLKGNKVLIIQIKHLIITIFLFLLSFSAVNFISNYIINNRIKSIIIMLLLLIYTIICIKMNKRFVNLLFVNENGKLKIREDIAETKFFKRKDGNNAG